LDWGGMAGYYGYQGGASPHDAMRQQMVATLTALEGVETLSRDVLLARVQQPGSTLVYTLRITLPADFPSRPPVIHISPDCKHAWVDQTTMTVTGCSEIQNWTVHRNLGSAINKIRYELFQKPPVLSSASEVKPAMQSTGSSGGPAQSMGAGSSARTSTMVPEVPSKIAELEGLSLEELQALCADDAKFVDFYNELSILKRWDEELLRLRTENVSLATANLAEERPLQELKAKLVQQHQDLSVQKRLYDENQKKVQELAANFSKPQIRAQLIAARDQAQRESEALFDSFGKGEITDLVQFTTEFKKARRDYHIRRMKEEHLSAAK